MKNRKTVSYITLGCKLNFAETASIIDKLVENGFSQVEEGEGADVVIINTCTVTDVADKKCRTAINRAVRENPEAFVIVTGCMAQLKADEIKRISGVSLVLGANDKFKIPDILKSEVGEQSHICSASRAKSEFHFATAKGHRTRHFLKVQDGCDYFCSYCTIPFARGRSRNPSIESLVEETKRSAEFGAREIVLTGVNVGEFKDEAGGTFFDLIQALDKVEGIERFRISSIEPNLLSEEMISFVASSKKFAPHFHLPLQSGSDYVLGLMKRKYSTELFRSRIEVIKRLIPNAFIGIDVIVGMRGEEECYFNETYEFLKGIEFAQLHVFPYSERAGTQALKIPYQVSERDKKERVKMLLALSKERLKEFYTRHLGSTQQVLWESTKGKELMYGFTENYIRSCREYDEKLVNKVETVTLHNLNEEDEEMPKIFVK